MHTAVSAIIRYTNPIGKFLKMVEGSCLCGGIKFTITGSIRNIVYCHCAQCRKAQGGLFVCNGVVARKDYQITIGENLINAYESSPGKKRYFCSHCGSPIKSEKESLPDQVRVRLGLLDGEINERPMAHIFWDSRIKWCEIEDNLPKYETFETERTTL